MADKNISKLKGSLGDGFDGAIDSAETELKAKIAKLAEEEIVRNTDSLRSLDDESLISSMAEQLKPLFLASSGFNVITRDEYKEIMIFALDKAANHFSKKKESAKAAALRQFSLSVKNAEPGDDAFVKILEKKPVKSRKKI